MRTVKNKILQYSITFLACAIIIFIVLAIRGIFRNPGMKDMMLYFTDAFFSVGIICAMVGLLIFVSNGGVFDMMVYGVYRFITLFKKDHTDVKYPTFYDYRVMKAERPKAEFLFLVIVGVVYVAASMIFLALWYKY